MALLWMDGFDHYGTGATGVANMLDGVWAGHIASDIVSDRSRTGANSLKLNQVIINPEGARRVFPGATKAIVGIGYALWMDELPGTNNSQQVFSLHNSSNTPRVAIGMDTTGRATLHMGSIDDATSFTSTDPCFIAGAWQFLEARFDVSGTVELRINGLVIFTQTGLTFGSTGNLAQVVFGPRGFSGSQDKDMWIDDLFAWDTTGSFNNDFIGDRRVRTYFPNADALPQEWSPGGQSQGYDCINEATPNDDTDYILAPFGGGIPSNGIISEFGMQDIAEEIAGISGVQTYIRARKTEAGTCNVQVGMTSNAVTGPGTDRPITSEWTYWTDIFEADPDTGGPWSKAGLDAATVNITRTA